LIEAIRYGNLEIARILLQDGNASPILPEELSGSTPLEVASEQQQEEENKSGEEMFNLILQYISERDREEQLASIVGSDGKISSSTAAMDLPIDMDFFSCRVL